MKAFPTPTHNLTNDGMDLRDYFAAKAMQALITSNPHAKGWLIYAEKTAYLIADAMMIAREEKK